MKYVVVCCALHDGYIGYNIFDTEEEAVTFIDKDIFLATGEDEHPSIYVSSDKLNARVIGGSDMDLAWVWKTIKV